MSPALSKSPPFSLQEFNDLVCAAFKLQHPHDLFALPSPSPYPRDSLYHLSSPALPSVSSCFESDTEDEEDDTHPPSTAHTRAPSARLSAYTASASTSPRFKPRSSSTARTALNVFKRVRTRASALVLRSANINNSRPSTAASTSASSTRTIRLPGPSSILQSRPSTPSTRPTSPFPREAFVPSSSTNAPSAADPSTSFLQFSSKGASSSPYPAGRICVESLPSFFEDTGYARTPAPSYSRPATPLRRGPGAGSLPLSIHTRLPPLRKTKSHASSLFGWATSLGASSGRQMAQSHPPVPCALGDASNTDHDRRCPSPYTCPRDPPPIPLPSRASSSTSEWRDGGMQPPAYVFARRGSATSSCTTMSTKSTTSLSERLANLLPLPLRSRSRSRSKLNLSILSADSSPGGSASTRSRDTWSPITPTGVFAFPAVSQPCERDPYGSRTSLADVHSERNFIEDDELHALSIGRVLTPELDPFAKADIALPPHALGLGFDATPRASVSSVDPSLSTEMWARPWMRESQTYIHEPWASESDADARGRASWSARLSSAGSPDRAYTYSFPAPSTSSSFSASRSLQHSLSINTSPTHAVPPSAWSPCSSAFSSSSESSSSASRRASASFRRSMSVPSSPAPSVRSLSGPCPVPPLPPPHRPLPDIPPSESPPPVPPKDASLSSSREEAPTLAHRHTSPAHPHTTVPPSPPSPVSPRSRASLPAPPTPRSWVSGSSRGSRRSERPPSPFPLVRGLSDGSEDMSSPRRTPAGKSPAKDPFCGVHEDEVKGWHDAEPSVETRSSGDTAPSLAASPRLPSHAPSASVDSTVTLTAAAMLGPLLPALSPPGISESAEEDGEVSLAYLDMHESSAHSDRDRRSATSDNDSDSWDRHTTHTARTTVSSMFYSARSSLGSAGSEGGNL